MSSVEQPSPESAVSTDIDWADTFEELGMDPAEPQSSTQVRSAVQVSILEVTSPDSAVTVIQDALSAGELVQQNGGIHVAGFQTETDSDADLDQQAADDEPDTTDETVEVSADIVERVEQLEAQNEEQAKAIAELRKKNSTLLEALTNFVEPDNGRTVVGELPEKMRSRGDTFD